MKKFEYSVCERNHTDLMDERSLDNFGKDGWELVSILIAGRHNEERQYIFKREKY